MTTLLQQFRLLDRGSDTAGGHTPAALFEPCRFCGIPATRFQAMHQTPTGCVSACPLCRACQILDRPRIDQEFVLIWLPPEVGQAAVNHLVRSCQMIFHAHGEPPHMTERPRSDTPALRAAYRSFQALLDLIPLASAHLNTTSPRDLWEALSGLSDDHLRRARPRLASIRLLSLGHFYSGGTDIYPDILDAWLEQKTRGKSSHDY